MRYQYNFIEISSDLSGEIFFSPDTNLPIIRNSNLFIIIILEYFMRLETSILHSLAADELTGAISTPIYQTSTYVQEAPGVNKGYDYARSNNPTRKVLEDLSAKLEFGKAGLHLQADWQQLTLL